MKRNVSLATPQFRVLVIASISLCGATLPGAQPESRPRQDFWVTDGVVNSILATNGVVYLGGEFKQVAPPGGRGSLVNVYSAESAPLLPQANGAILSVIPDGAGGWYIGGQFSAVGGFARTNIARLMADLSVDPNWHPDPSGSTNRVFAMVRGSNAVYVAGVFTNIAGAARSNLAALDPVTGTALPWNGTVQGEVYALTLHGSNLYVGGIFTSVGGQPRSHLASVNANTGDVTGWNPVVTGIGSFEPGINALAADQGLIYVGGFFTNIAGVGRNYIAALDPVTGQPTNWNPDADDGVQALAVFCNTVYAAGYFTRMGGRARGRIAAVDVVSGQATDWNPQADAELFALAAAGNVIYAGGLFTTIGGEARNSVAAIDLATGRATPWNPKVDRGILALALAGDQVFAGGGINAGAIPRANLAAFDVATGRALAWAPNPDGPVYALAAAGSTVYAGGNFNRIGGAERRSIAAVDAFTGQATAWRADAAGFGDRTQIRALATGRDALYAGGLFASVGGAGREFLAALDLTTGQARAWDPAPDNTVLSLAVCGRIYFDGRR